MDKNDKLGKYSKRIEGIPIKTEMMAIAQVYNLGKYVDLECLTINKSYKLREISFMLQHVEDPHPYFVHRMITKCEPKTINIEDDLHPMLIKMLSDNPIYLKAKKQG